MSWPTVPNSFSPATKARSSEINSNFSAIKDAIASSVTKSNTDYVITDTDGYRVILVSTGNTTRTITLPTAADNSQRIITIKKVDSGTGAVTIDGENSETIDGQLTKSLNVQYDFYELQCDGTNWNIISTSSASSGSGAGSVNYIQTSSKAWDMEATITGWNTYKDAAAATPVDGTGGSPTVITIARNTTTPLNGVADLKISKSAANGQGEGVSIDVTVPSGYQYGYSGEITVLINTNTSNYVAGDFAFYVYDVTNSTLITPNVTAIPKYKGRYGITWGSSATGASYRLIMHCAVTTTLAYDIYIDDVIFGPSKVISAPRSSGGQSYTLTIGGASSAPTQASGALKTAYWSADSDRMNIDFDYYQNGAGGAAGSGIYLFPLPTGYTIDTNKYTSNQDAGNRTLGTASFRVGSTYYRGTVHIYDANNLYCVLFNDTTTLANAGSGNIGLNNTTVAISFRASVYISQWAGSTYMGANDSECYYNTDSSATATVTTGSAIGRAGVFGSGWAVGTGYTRRIVLNSRLQTDEELELWIYHIANGTYHRADSRYMPSYYGQGTNSYGWAISAADTTGVNFDVSFMAGGASSTNATYAGNGQAWSTFNGTFNWFVVRRKIASAAGFGYATATQSGLYVAGQAPGQISGAAIGAGYIGQIIYPTLSTQNVSAAWVNVGSIALTPGVWMLTGCMDGSGTSTDVINLGWGTSNTGSPSISCIANVVGVNVRGNLPTSIVNISTNTTYYIMAYRSTGAGASWGNGLTTSQFAVRIA